MVVLLCVWLILWEKLLLREKLSYSLHSYVLMRKDFQSNHQENDILKESSHTELLTELKITTGESSPHLTGEEEWLIWLVRLGMAESLISMQALGLYRLTAAHWKPKSLGMTLPCLLKLTFESCTAAADLPSSTWWTQRLTLPSVTGSLLLFSSSSDGPEFLGEIEDRSLGSVAPQEDPAVQPQ